MQRWGLEDLMNHLYIYLNPPRMWNLNRPLNHKKTDSPPKSSILIGFSLIFTIHSWVPLETPTWCLQTWSYSKSFTPFLPSSIPYKNYQETRWIFAMMRRCSDCQARDLEIVSRNTREGIVNDVRTSSLNLLLDDSMIHMNMFDLNSGFL